MADNIIITPGTGATVATDDIGSGVQVQRVKPVYGDDGAAVDPSLLFPFPMRFGSPATANLSSAAISAAGSGDNSLLAGTASQTIRVFRLFMQNTGASEVSFKFRSGTTDFHPALLLARGGSFFLDFDGEPWFVTTVAEAFQINLSAALQMSGRFYYTKSA